ncbi:Uncharacterised protein [Mycobacteroides abscessus subsp. abscessus]|nr:Uncharacterised protein [Mycobacteroides abscessus subsp. abscessus]
MRAPSWTRSANSRDVSVLTGRRTGAPFSPVIGSRGGSHRATVRIPCGDPSATTSSTG